MRQAWTSDQRSAFALDAVGQRAKAAAKAAWWSATGGLARAITRPTQGESARSFQPEGAPVSKERLRRVYLEAFEKDARDVAAGLYPAVEDAPVRPIKSLLRAWTSWWTPSHGRSASPPGRRRRGQVGGLKPKPIQTTIAKTSTTSRAAGSPPESARRYDAQVEALFAGTAGAMRRRGLALLAKHWRGRDHRDLKLVDAACGSGAFLRDLKAAFPARGDRGPGPVLGLSGQGAAAVRRRTVQANIESLPFADGALDAVSCVYLFHELPPRVRPVVAAAIARSLKPGGVLVFVDSVQPVDDTPDLARLLEAFPAYFHEPYYSTYAQTDLAALFSGAGLRLVDQDQAFLTKAMLFEKV
jgi:ubiquinone/menaquinone biosynthesis C-methylase UbiE